MEPLVELCAREARPHRVAVAEQAQVALAPVDDPPAGRVGDPRLGHVPLPRRGPVEDRRAGRHLGHGERDELADEPQRLPDAVPRKAARDRHEPAREVVDLGAGRCRVEPGAQPARTSFLHRNASAKRVGEFDSIPRTRASERKRSSVNQCLPRCEGKCSSRRSTLRWRTSGASGTYTFGAARSASYFGISYSRIRWSRKVFQVSSETSRWSWCRSTPTCVKTNSGETSSFSASKRSFTAPPRYGKKPSRKVSSRIRGGVSRPDRNA